MIKQLIIVCVFAGIFMSCDEIDSTTIYGYEVNCQINLSAVTGLVGANTYATFVPPKSFPHGFTVRSVDRFGFGGLLVYNVDGIQMLAYDVACPVERDNQIRVQPQENVTAVCPECGAVYSLTSGVCVSGEKQALQTYVARQDNTNPRIYYITNY